MVGKRALGGDGNQGPENPPSRVQFDLVGFKVCFININWAGGTNCLSGTKYVLWLLVVVGSYLHCLSPEMH